jgi:hypothetical protein
VYRLIERERQRNKDETNVMYAFLQFFLANSSEFLAADPEVPGLIPDAKRFSEK